MSRTTQEFGSAHTEAKLDAVQKYLSAFTTALKKQKFTLLYVDACAGSGSSMPKSARDIGSEWQNGLGIEEPVLDKDRIVDGSAKRALSVNPPFDRYILNDLKRANVASLRAMVRDQFGHLADRVTFSQRDANQMLQDLCRHIKWKESRAVVFLDPFGLQIKYETLCALAATEAIDLWYLVPVFAMYRQVRNDGQVIDDGGKSVDEALGTTEWREVVVVEESLPGLFSDTVTSRKAVDVAWFEKIAKQRLETAFEGRVLDRVLPLGRNGLHEFSLMFASANPSERAWSLASKLAMAVLK